MKKQILVFLIILVILFLIARNAHANTNVTNNWQLETPVNAFVEPSDNFGGWQTVAQGVEKNAQYERREYEISKDGNFAGYAHIYKFIDTRNPVDWWWHRWSDYKDGTELPISLGLPVGKIAAFEFDDGIGSIIIQVDHWFLDIAFEHSSQIYQYVPILLRILGDQPQPTATPTIAPTLVPTPTPTEIIVEDPIDPFLKHNYLPIVRK